MPRSAFLPLLILPFLAACSDLRATCEIQGSAHALTLIRVIGMPWEKKAKYSLVAARMPDCMRRHALPDAGLDARFEIHAPGNNAWIIRRNGTLHVVETRTCEGFARLDREPEGGIGPLLGTFQMRGDKLVFVAAAGAPAAPGSGTDASPKP